MRIRSLLQVLALSLLAIPATAHAQDGARDGRGVDLGPQILYGGDTDLGVGGRLIVNVESLPNWDFLASFNVWFPDANGADVNAWEGNANLAYNFLIEDVESIFPYVGAGLNIFHVSVENNSPGNGDFDNTDLGVNLFGGTKFTAGSLTPFAEVRVVIEGSDQVVLAFGLLF